MRHVSCNSDPCISCTRGLIMLMPPCLSWYITATCSKELHCTCSSWMNPCISVTPSLPASKCELSIWSKEWNIFPIRMTDVKYIPLSFPFSLQSSFEFWDPLQFCSTLDVTMIVWSMTAATGSPNTDGSFFFIHSNFLHLLAFIEPSFSNSVCHIFLFPGIYELPCRIRLKILLM